MVESRINIDTLCHFSGMGEILGQSYCENAQYSYGSIVASSTSMIGMLSFTA